MSKTIKSNNNKRLFIPLAILIALLSVFFLVYSSSKDGGFICDDNGRMEIKQLEERFSKLQKYPNVSSENQESSCNWPDGTPTVTYNFSSPDSKDKVWDYYEKYLKSENWTIEKVNETPEMYSATRPTTFESAYNSSVKGEDSLSFTYKNGGWVVTLKLSATGN